MMIGFAFNIAAVPSLGFLYCLRILLFGTHHDIVPEYLADLANPLSTVIVIVTS